MAGKRPDAAMEQELRSASTDSERHSGATDRDLGCSRMDQALHRCGPLDQALHRCGPLDQAPRSCGPMHQPPRRRGPMHQPPRRRGPMHHEPRPCGPLHRHPRCGPADGAFSPRRRPARRRGLALAALLLLAACGGEPAPPGDGDRSSPPLEPALETLPDLAAREVPREGAYKLRDRDRHPVGRRLAYLLLKASAWPSVPYAEIQRRLVGDVVGVSFGHLKALCDDLRIPARAAFLPLGQALERLPAILAVAPRLPPVRPEDVGFLLVREALPDDRFAVTDPVAGAAVLTRAELAARYRDGAFFLEGTPPPAPAEPDLGLAELVWSWGRVEAGTLVRHPFRLWNRGQKPLVILAAEPSCGCLAAPVTKGDTPAPPPKGTVRRNPATGRWEVHFPRTFAPITLAPGEKAWLTAYYDTTHRVGHLPVQVTLVTNDPDEERVTVAMEGYVAPVFESDPPYGWRWPKIAVAEGATALIWIRNVKGKSFRILAVEANHPAVKVELAPDADRAAPPQEQLPPGVRPRPHPAAEGWQALRVRVLPGAAKPGALSAVITVKTDLSPVPLTYGVSGEVTGNLVAPPVLDFGRVPAGHKASRSFELKSLTGSLTLKAARISRPDLFTVSHERLGPGRYRVTVSLRPGWLAPVLEGTLVLETDDPLEPLRTVAVRGFVGRPVSPIR